MRLRPRQIDPDHTPRTILHGLLDQDLVQGDGELPRQAEDQPRPHAVFKAGAVHPSERRVDDVVEVALSLEVSLHRVETQLDQRDCARAELLADDLVDRTLDGGRRRLNFLRPLVQDRQIVAKRRHRVGPRGDEIAELPVGGDRQLEALIVRDRPQDVWRHRSADVDVQVAELGARIQHPFECTAPERDPRASRAGGTAPGRIK